MKLYGTIAVHVQATDILRSPRFFEKVKRAFGGKPDLRSGKVRAAIEATALVDASRDALRRVGATNAVSLVIDETVLFHDRDSKEDDLGDLFLAFHDNASVFGQGFNELRLAIEHRESGLHLVIEVQARTEHPKDSPAIRIIVSGRAEALEPKPGEDADAYRKRAEPVATDAKALEVYQKQFESFVDRLKEAVAAAMPTARAEVERAEARIVRPDKTDKSGKPGKPTTEVVQHYDTVYYDPYLAYYPSPLGFVAETLLWSAVFSMAMAPHFVVVDHHNHVQGWADDPGIEHGPTIADTAADESWWSDNDTETLSASDHSDYTHQSDDGGSWWGGDGGGDSWWGGDGGGFDGGSFD